MAKSVRVTLELTNEFIGLLKMKSGLCEWHKAFDEGKEMDAGAITAFLILMEAMGATEEQVHIQTPLMWRNAGIEVVHEERRVYKDGVELS